MTNLEKRFWAKVPHRPENGCWEWAASKLPSGYGQLFAGRGLRPLRAHRLSYELTYGPIPAGSMVRHECDNPSCVRPDHLVLGTAKDNARDMITRGRYRHVSTHGEKCGSAKLSDSDVLAIRADKISAPTSLARKFGVTYQTIWAIRKGISRKLDASGQPVEVE